MNLAKLQQQLTLEEGKSLKMYLDSMNIPTIGIGHNLRDKPISEHACQIIFEDDVAEVVTLLNKYMPWWIEQDDVRQNAIIDLAFNLGVGPCEENPTGKLLKWTHSLSSLQAKDYEKAANNLASSEPWHTQVGTRADRIVAMIRTGEW